MRKLLVLLTFVSQGSVGYMNTKAGRLIKRGFTLLEVLISLAIISILVGIVFGIYTSILRLNVRLEQEKNLNNELLFATQTIQNIVDSYDLDLGYYFTGGVRNNIDSKGYTDTLAFVDGTKQLTIRKQGDCGSISGCFLALVDGQVVKQLTNPHKVSLPVLQFRIIPYQFGSVDHIFQKGFWIYGSISSNRYSTGKFELNVSQDIQLFFTIRKY
ncbi:MAG TPA: prepilin-type N-terminal cleavage/methylation domain-containing protein [Candidatus Absconditabacterales bacterium]|nr:prepilin-type N-terminal cleavage/methylation domain-containing protein [Candidatus Absconditabacterales bacterium]